MVDNKVEVEPKLSLEQKKTLLKRDKAVCERLERQIVDEEKNIADTKKNVPDTKTSIGASGTAGTIPIADYTTSAKVTVYDSKVDSDIVKVINENKVIDPFEWYIKRVLRRV